MASTSAGHGGGVRRGWLWCFRGKAPAVSGRPVNARSSEHKRAGDLDGWSPRARDMMGETASREEIFRGTEHGGLESLQPPVEGRLHRRIGGKGLGKTRPLRLGATRGLQLPGEALQGHRSLSPPPSGPPLVGERHVPRPSAAKKGEGARAVVRTRPVTARRPAGSTAYSSNRPQRSPRQRRLRSASCPSSVPDTRRGLTDRS